MEKFLEQYREMPAHVKAIILILLTAASAYYSYLEYVEPAFAVRQAAIDEMAALEQEIQSLNSAGQNIVAVEQEIRKADEDLFVLLELLPGDPEIDNVLGLFAAAAKESGVEIRDFEPLENSAEAPPAAAPPAVPNPPAADEQSGGPSDASQNAGASTSAEAPVVDDSVTKTPIKLKVNGTFAQLAVFLDSTLGLPRVLRVVNLDLNAPSGSDKPKESGGDSQGVLSDGSPRLQADVTFEAYSQKGNLEQIRSEKRAPEPSVVPPAAPAPDGADLSLSAKPLSDLGGVQ